MTAQTEPTVHPLGIERIRRANAEAGKFFFQPETMRFFRSRAATQAYRLTGSTRAYFVTSEQFSPSAPRLYTVRVCDLTTGEIDTVGEFQAYAHRSTADRAARRLAAQESAQ